MNEKYNDFKNEYDSLKDVAEYQRNMYNPGHYVGTGRVSPLVSAPGNATPWAVISFIAAAAFLAFGLFLFFSDARVIDSSGLVKDDFTNKIIALIIMLAISAFALILGFAYVRKAKRYYKMKAQIKSEPKAEGQDKLWQRKCPKCEKYHDIDYPKCPYCKFNYLEEV